MNAPLRVPTKTRTLLMRAPFLRFAMVCFLRKSSLRSLRSLFNVHHPRRAKTIYEHGKSLRPERCAERHDDVALLRKRVKDSPALGDVLNVDVYVEALGFLEALRRSIHAHQYLVANRHVRVHDLVAPVGRHVL